MYLPLEIRLWQETDTHWFIPGPDLRAGRKQTSASRHDTKLIEGNNNNVSSPSHAVWLIFLNLPWWVSSYQESRWELKSTKKTSQPSFTGSIGMQIIGTRRGEPLDRKHPTRCHPSYHVKLRQLQSQMSLLSFSSLNTINRNSWPSHYGHRFWYTGHSHSSATCSACAQWTIINCAVSIQKHPTGVRTGYPGDKTLEVSAIIAKREGQCPSRPLGTHHRRSGPVTIDSLTYKEFPLSAYERYSPTGISLDTRTFVRPLPSNHSICSINRMWGPYHDWVCHLLWSSYTEVVLSGKRWENQIRKQKTSDKHK